ncbi:MAG: hypothetical protein KatS3mg014_2458 [Actinomycetota bacterium]|nr:MAG: hypothetical protein KatS3mg014_2458 [Actinomycetota bacterium]
MVEGRALMAGVDLGALDLRRALNVMTAILFAHYGPEGEQAVADWLASEPERSWDRETWGASPEAVEAQQRLMEAIG